MSGEESLSSKGFGVCLVCVWCVFGVCSVCVWCVSGVCLLCVYCVSCVIFFSLNFGAAFFFVPLREMVGASVCVDDFCTVIIRGQVLIPPFFL